MSRPNTPRHRGFTLVELLVVIVVIAVLIGLLTPAVMNSVRTARDAACSTEINAMAQALADFKNKYGEYPPSRIICCENGNYSSTNVGTSLAPLVPRSVAALRKYWPRMQISTSGTPAVISSSFFYDFNGNNTADATPYVLSGAECLVFFLGGIPQPIASNGVQTGLSVSGFSRLPTNPMISATLSTNRTSPLFEFNVGRLTDIDSDGMPEYKDSLGVDIVSGNTAQSWSDSQGVYFYFSVYNGIGYDPDDDAGAYANAYSSDSASVNPESDDSATYEPALGAFMTSNAATGGAPGAAHTTRPDFIASQPPNPYLNEDPIPVASGGGADTTNTKPRSWINPQSFQIISPGRDRVYGIGGQYATKSNIRLPFTSGLSGALKQVTNQDLYLKDRNIRFREKDNITNFSPGSLD